MADTHVNAFFMAVDEAAQEVAAANAKWNAAKIALEAKKKEVDWKEPEDTTEETVPETTEKSNSNPFKKK